MSGSVRRGSRVLKISLTKSKMEVSDPRERSCHHCRLYVTRRWYTVHEKSREWHTIEYTGVLLPLRQLWGTTVAGVQSLLLVHRVSSRFSPGTGPVPRFSPVSVLRLRPTELSLGCPNW